LSYWPTPNLQLGLLGFPVQSVRPFMRAEFLYLKPTGRKFFILRRCIITTLTFRTGQCNNITHNLAFFQQMSGSTMRPQRTHHSRRVVTVYLITSVTRPAPTVRPPSRIAKRMCCSIAIGVISITSIVTLSPGITISTPSGSVMSPVTSVVRK